jgi:hypothetical protein
VPRANKSVERLKQPDSQGFVKKRDEGGAGLKERTGNLTGQDDGVLSSLT